MNDCIFCKIANKEIPSDIVYEDDLVVAFKDTSPTAPHHILVIPKQHISSANDLTKDNAAIVSHIFLTIAKLAKENGFAENGYRVVNNCGKDGGQTVQHLHFHLLGGREFGWPAG